jgi:hypothetical protein
MYPRRLVTVLLPLWLAAVAPQARAQAPGSLEQGEGIDDPKVARRLGTRIELAPVAAPTPAVPPAAIDAASPEGAAVRASDAASEASRDASPDPSHGSLAPLPADARLGPAGEVEAARPGVPTEAPRTPRFKLGYRYFKFAQIGATASSGPGADEPFDVLSLDLYPVSSTWRFGLTTQYGWQGGTFRQGGDAFIAQSVSLGGQIPGAIFTPFFEVYAGGGYMQRTHAGLNAVATAYGQLGIDVGSEVFLASHFCLSGAIGFIHAGNAFVKDATFGSFSVDTLSFKVGVGL